VKSKKEGRKRETIAVEESFEEHKPEQKSFSRADHS
jgi:hypothetical protein